MSLGFAAIACVAPTPPTFIVAADSRITFGDDVKSDAGLKTYELGGRAAAVAAGSALPAIHAADIVRTIVENHNRRTPERRLGFYDTTRLFSFFLKRAADAQGAQCEIAIAGFLNSQVPAIALVHVTPARSRVIFQSVEPGEKAAIAVGSSEGGRVLMRGLASLAGKPIIAPALSLLWYIAQHPGAFESIGGGLSVGTCTAEADSVSWPIIEIAGRRFLRGLDVTDSYRPNWPPPVTIDYDDGWCEGMDRRFDAKEDTVEPGGVEVSDFDIDSLSTADTLFQTHDDPKRFVRGAAEF